MTEQQIEQTLQARLAALDQEYIHSRMTPAAYRARWATIERWAQDQYAACQGRPCPPPDYPTCSAGRFG